MSPLSMRNELQEESLPGDPDTEKFSSPRSRFGGIILSQAKP
ncbi:hypothetical protein P4055_00030 [Pseudomonas aeruginosa]|nr:hypothetical protein [Pseudomonas aeruginosa]